MGNLLSSKKPLTETLSYRGSLVSAIEISAATENWVEYLRNLRTYDANFIGERRCSDIDDFMKAFVDDRSFPRWILSGSSDHDPETIDARTAEKLGRLCRDHYAKNANRMRATLIGAAKVETYGFWIDAYGGFWRTRAKKDRGDVRRDACELCENLYVDLHAAATARDHKTYSDLLSRTGPCDRFVWLKAERERSLLDDSSEQAINAARDTATKLENAFMVSAAHRSKIYRECLWFGKLATYHGDRGCWLTYVDRLAKTALFQPKLAASLHSLRTVIGDDIWHRILQKRPITAEEAARAIGALKGQFADDENRLHYYAIGAKLVAFVFE